MGEVYLAEDTGLKRQVALKRITSSLYGDTKSRQRLWKEAELASRLNDPHIAAVYDVIEDGDEMFVVMEYVEGETLRSRLSRPLTIAEFLPIATQCASALSAAHRAGLLHRDIKPENIMLTPTGQVKALDFGVAREMARFSEATTEEQVESVSLCGTLLYMAPEVLKQKSADGRADIFSLGVVFYEALAGKNPFRHSGFLQTCDALLHDEPRPLRELNSEVPEGLERVIGNMLAKNPRDRYSSAAELCADLEALQGKVAIPLPSDQGTDSTRTNRARLRLAILAAVLLGTVALVGASLYLKWRSPILNEHDSILLADFENQTDNKIFDTTVTEAVRHALEQSRYVHLVPRSQLVEAEQRMGRAGATPLDPSRGREICKRENIRAMLTGRVTGSGSKYRVTAQVVDPLRETTVLAEEASFDSPSDLYTAVDNLARRLRSHLGESMNQIQEQGQPLKRVTTTSLDALQRYSRAMDLYATGDLEGFLPLAKSAIELDGDFAMAHLYLSRAYSVLGDEKAAQLHMARCREGLERVTERERYLILGADFDNQGKYEQAAEQYQLLTDLYPDDVDGYRLLANSSVWAGHLEKAIIAQRRAVQLAPQSTVTQSQLILLLVRLNKFPEAVDAYESAIQQGAKGPLLHWGTGIAYLGKGDTSSARKQFEQLREEGGSYEANLSSLYLARVLIYDGRLREAVDALRSGLVLDEKLHSESWMPVRRYLLARVLLLEGKKASATEELKLLEKTALNDAEPEDMRRAGLLAVDLGDVAGARKIAAKMGTLPSMQGSAYTRNCYYNLKGAVERASGKTDAAIDSQRRAAIFYPSYQTYLALGEDYTARKDWENASEAYQHYLDFHGEILHEDLPSNWVLAHLWIARSFAGAGDSKKSLQYYDEFLRLWANADSDLSILRAARVEREKLNPTIRDGLTSD